MYRPIIFVTGANTGLGLEIVKSLFQSATSYTILLGSRREDKADLAVQQLGAEFPDSATVVTPVQVDIEDDKSIEQAFDFIAKQYGRVDVLINNAGKVEPVESGVLSPSRRSAHRRVTQAPNLTLRCIPET